MDIEASSGISFGVNNEKDRSFVAVQAEAIFTAAGSQIFMLKNTSVDSLRLNRNR